MGMSASQARLLSLQARQSNLEYQGQQINQERTILSQQATSLYNSLLEMQVPTPPSTSDYTTIEYSGTSGTVNYTFSANDVKPGSNGLYNVTLGYTDYGHSLTQNNGYKTTAQGSETIKATPITITYTETVTGYQETEDENPQGYLIEQASKPASGEYYILNDEGQYVKGGKEDETYNKGYFVFSSTKPEETEENNYFGVNGFSKEVGDAKTFTSEQLSNIYTKNGELCTDVEGAVQEAGDGLYTLVESKGPFYMKDENGQTNLTVPNDTGYTIAGKTAYELTTDIVTQDEYDGYVLAIENSGLKKANGEAYTVNDFYVYFDDNHNIHFALKEEVERAKTGANNTCTTYDYIANGQFTKNVPYDNAKLSFDPASGRITSIEIPSTYDENNEPLSYTTIDVSAKETTNTAEYEDAYNEYEYQQYLYDKKQKEINAKTSIIQQEDRNLELKLQRLDNERTQITTEIEAVDKVINDNIESSYKTFSG